MLDETTYRASKRDKGVETSMIREVIAITVIISISAVAAGELMGEEKSEFDALVKRLNYNPDDLEAGDRLRSICRKNDANGECIDALNELTKRHPKNRSLRYQAALSYVDEVPGHSLFRQGWLSSRSMEHMSEVIHLEPNDWAAYYIRGLNGLYWPRSFRKLPKAITDLTTCIDLSKKLPDGLVKPYHGLAYIALGDAYVKNKDIEKGREIYSQGSKAFESSEMKKRLSMNDEELSNFIKEFRHTDKAVDTEISFLLGGGAEKL